jgi:hypothetical protein
VIVATADKTPRLTFKTEAGVLLQVCASRAATGNEELVAIRASHIQFSLAPEANNAPGTIRRRMFHGDFVQYLVATPMGDLVVRRPPRRTFRRAARSAFHSPQNIVCFSAGLEQILASEHTFPLLDERLRISAKILQSLLTNSIFPIY